MRVTGLVGKLLLLAVSVGLALTAADAVVRVTDVGFRPLRSPANADTVLESSEFRTRVRTNALGFREPRLPAPKPPGTRRIVVVGDSFTQGYGVEEDEAYPRVLESLLPGVEVINLGVPATCPLDYAANFEDVGRAYEPDLVLVGLMANDIIDIVYLRDRGGRLLLSILHQEQDRLADPLPFWKHVPARLWPDLYAFASRVVRGPEGRGASAARQPEDGRAPPTTVPPERWREVLHALAARYRDVDGAERRLATLPPDRLERIRTLLTAGRESDEEGEAMSELLALVEPRHFVDLLGLPSTFDAAWNETTRLLARIAAAARRSGAEAMVVYVPGAQEVTAARLELLVSRGFEVDYGSLAQPELINRLQRFGADSGIPIVDLRLPLRAHRDEALYFTQDGHWTPRGHRVAAEAIAAAITARWRR